METHTRGKQEIRPSWECVHLLCNALDARPVQESGDGQDARLAGGEEEEVHGGDQHDGQNHRSGRASELKVVMVLGGTRRLLARGRLAARHSLV